MTIRQVAHIAGYALPESGCFECGWAVPWRLESPERAFCMAQPSGVAAALTTVILASVLAGCGGETTSTVTTTTVDPSSTTSQAPTTTTSSLGELPEPLLSGLLQPGEYETTVFEPTVRYQIEQVHPLSAFQTPYDTGLQNKNIWHTAEGMGIARYKGVAVHNWWLGLTPDEILAELGKIEGVEFATPTQTEFDGLPAIEIEGTVPRLAVLWQNRAKPGGGQLDSWNLEPRQQIRLIIVTSPAGSLVITVQAAAEEWDEFLPIAQEILAAISFPDLD